MNRMFQSKTGRVALVGVLSACSVVVLFIACISPSGKLGLAAAAGLFPMFSVLAIGRAAGCLCWVVSGFLGLLLLPDKNLAMLYLLFLGLYPVLKSRIEAFHNLPLELLCKLIFFNLVFALFFMGLFDILSLPLPQWLANRAWLAYLIGDGVFLVYDIGLSKLIARVSKQTIGGH